MVIRVSMKKWGHGPTGGYLLRPDNGKMCCLGFACRQLPGVTALAILGKCMPDDLVVRSSGSIANKKLLTRLVKAKLVSTRTNKFGSHNSAFSSAASDINDDHTTSVKAKQQALRKLFKRYGHKIVFVP